MEEANQKGNGKRNKNGTMKLEALRVLVGNEAKSSEPRQQGMEASYEVVY